MQIAELRHLEAAMRDALAELYARASTGERNRDVAELAQHVRELTELLDEGLAEITADPGVETLRAFAKNMATRLAAIEWELAGPGCNDPGAGSAPCWASSPHQAGAAGNRPCGCKRG